MFSKQVAQGEPGEFIYDIYTYRRDPETKLSPWQRMSTQDEILDAQSKAYELHKSRLYERIEIQQRCPSNTNNKVIKVYKRKQYMTTTPVIVFSLSVLALAVSFLVTYFLLL